MEHYMAIKNPTGHAPPDFQVAWINMQGSTHKHNPSLFSSDTPGVMLMAINSAKRAGFHGDIDGATGKLCPCVCACVCACLGERVLAF